MLKINGTRLPAPTELSVSIQDLSKSERNVRGTMIKELIATKRKLDITWMYLDRLQFRQILDLVSNNFFDVEYPDPQTGDQRSGTFYAGDRKVGGQGYKNGVMQWRDCKFSVIER